MTKTVEMMDYLTIRFSTDQQGSNLAGLLLLYAAHCSTTLVLLSIGILLVQVTELRAFSFSLFLSSLHPLYNKFLFT